MLEFWTNKDGLVEARVESSPGATAQSTIIGDGGPEGAIEAILELANEAGLEVDDSESVDGLGPFTIGIAAGS